MSFNNFSALLATFLFLSCGCFPCLSQNADTTRKNNLQEENLFGKVKSVRVSSYIVTGLTEEVPVSELSRTFMKTYTIYNSSGYMVEKYFYNDSSGTLTGRDSCKYDSNGFLLETVIFNPDGSLRSSNINTYDKMGNMTETIYNINDGSLRSSKTTFTYDKMGNMTEKILYLNDGSVKSREVYAYDRKGNVTRFDRYIADGSLNSSVSYKYDNNGKRLYTQGGNWKRYCTYDNQGNLIKEEDVLTDGNIGVTRQYDGRGNETVYMTNPRDVTKRRDVRVRYEYDEMGNATKSASFVNGKLQSITGIGIEYY